MRPALTAEEWAKVPKGEGFPSGAAWLFLTKGNEYLSVNAPSGEDHANLADGSRLALAALGLYGQPFGFTREDVSRLAEMIRLSAETESNLDSYLNDAALWQWMESLRARIAALLPPADVAPDT